MELLCSPRQAGWAGSERAASEFISAQKSSALLGQHPAAALALGGVRGDPWLGVLFPLGWL